MAYSKKATEKWRSENVRKITLAFVKKSDAEVLKKLDSVPSKIQYIRHLILADIAANPTETE